MSQYTQQAHRAAVEHTVEPQGHHNTLQPRGYYMYRQFNIHQFHVLSTQCIYMFCVDLRTNSDYFPKQHKLIGFSHQGRQCLI